MVFMKSQCMKTGVSPTNKSMGDRSPMDNTPRRFNIELGKTKNKKNKKAGEAEDFHSALLLDVMRNLGDIDIISSFQKI